MNAHLGESAALYALGALERRERAEADEHLRSCQACRELVARAEADVTAIEASLPQLEPPPALRNRLNEALTPAAAARLRRRTVPAAWLAVAAAIVLAIVPASYLAYQNAAMHAAMVDDAEAMARIASSPHNVASFTGGNARVMYGKDGSWYCVVIRGAQRSAQVFWPHDGTQTILGTAPVRGGIAVLYLPKSHRMDDLAIVEDGKTIARAHLAFTGNL